MHLNKLPCRFHGGIFRGSAAHTKIGDGRHSDKLPMIINEKSENDSQCGRGLRFRGYCPRAQLGNNTNTNSNNNKDNYDDTANVPGTYWELVSGKSK